MKNGSPANVVKRHAPRFLSSKKLVQEYSTLNRNKSKMARPYIWRLIIFSRLFCRSTGSLLHSNIRADSTTVRFFWSDFAKSRNSLMPLSLAIIIRSSMFVAATLIRYALRKGNVALPVMRLPINSTNSFGRICVAF